MFYHKLITNRQQFLVLLCGIIVVYIIQYYLLRGWKSQEKVEEPAYKSRNTIASTENTEVVSILREMTAMDELERQDVLQDEIREELPLSSRAVNKDPPPRRPVYTYFEELSLHTDSIHYNMLRLWLRSWWSSGYNPIVLSRQHARLYPNYNVLYQEFDRFPTINNKHYEMACYLRWMALRSVGGGIFMDYDMFGIGKLELPKTIKESDLITNHGLIPMFTIAGPGGVDKILQTLASYSGEPTKERGLPHLSDMIILAQNQGMYRFFKGLLHVAHFSAFEYERFRKHSEMTADRDIWASDILLSHRLNRQKVYLLLPAKVKLGSGSGLDCASIPSIVEPLKKYFTVKNAFFNLQPLDKTFFPDPQGPTACKFRVVNQWPSTLVVDDLLLVAYSRHTLGNYPSKTIMAIRKQMGRLLPLPMDNLQGASRLVEYALGFRLRQQLSFMIENDHPEMQSDLFNMLNERYYALDDEIRKIEAQVSEPNYGL